MTTKPHILFFSGSTRTDSVNTKLARYAAAYAATLGVNAEFIDMKDYPMPLYDGDSEAAQGLPANAVKLKEKMIAADGFVFACPEYNSSITPLMKNMIDWTSRPHTQNEPALWAYKGKTAALLAASPGALGGLRGLVHVRDILGNIGVYVMPTQAAVGQAMQAFDANGDLTAEPGRKFVQASMEELVQATRGIMAEAKQKAA